MTVLKETPVYTGPVWKSDFLYLVVLIQISNLMQEFLVCYLMINYLHSLIKHDIYNIKRYQLLLTKL